MTTIVQRLRDERKVAMKARDAETKNTLTTLLSDVQNVGLNDGKRETTDIEAIAVVKMFIKKLQETIDAYDGVATPLLTQMQVYKSFLPTQLSDLELTLAVVHIVAGINDPSPRSMGVVMKQLKSQYEGQYDGKLASIVVKQVLSA